MRPWRATSAAAEPTNEFARRSSWQRGGRHEANRKRKPPEISSRRFWSGRARSRGSVCSVCATDFCPSVAFGLDERGGPGCVSSQSFCRDSAGRNRLHCCAPVGDGDRDPHIFANGAGGRTGCRLEEGEGRPGDRRQEIWRSKYRRLAISKKIFYYDARVRGGGAADVDAGGGVAVERSRHGVFNRAACCGSQGVRPAPGLRRTCFGGGAPCRAKERRATTEEALGVALHREGNDKR